MKQKKVFAFALLMIGVLTLFVAASADDGDKDKLGRYKRLTTIKVPGDLAGGFDISWANSESGRYYLADRGDFVPTTVPPTPPKNPRIDVIDTKHNKFLFAIPMSTGVNGVVAIGRAGDDDEKDQPNAGTLWVGGNDSTVKVIDLTHPFATPLSIATGVLSDLRADELAYDPKDHVILIANDRAPKPFVTFISTVSHMVLGKIVYDGTLGNPQTTGGIEQPVWDGVKKRFYLAIPSTAAHAKGEVDEIDPKTRAITRVFPTTCGPAGLALIPGQHLMTSCGDVIDIATGAVVHTVTPTVGGDEIWFNPGDERVYFGGGTDRISVNVVNGASPWGLITNLTVGHIFATNPPPNRTTHSVAADSENNRIFVPVGNVGIKVYSADDDDEEGSDN